MLLIIIRIRLKFTTVCFFLFTLVKIIISMLRKIRILLLLFIPLLASGQVTSSKADSLLLVLHKAKDADRVNILIDLNQFYKGDELGLQYANQAYELATKLGDKKGQAKALYAIGQYFFENADDVQAISYYLKSLVLMQEVDDKPNTIKLLRYIGSSYCYLDSFEKSKNYTQQAINLAIETNDKLEQGEALLNLADIHDKLYEQEEALKLCYQALALIEPVGKPSDLAKVYYALGRQYYNMSNYQKSIEYYLKVIEIQESINDYSNLINTHHMLGRTHRTIGNYQLALEHYQKSLRYSEQLNEKRSIAANSTEIGLVYFSLSRSLLSVDENEVNYRRALGFHEEALKIYQEDQDTRKIAESLNNIANTYSNLAVNNFVSRYGEFWEDSLILASPDTIRAAFQKTFEYYKQALEIFEQEGNLQEIINVNINLATHLIYTRRWTEVTQHLNKALRIARQTNSQPDLALGLLYYGEYYYRIKDYENAEQTLMQSLKIFTSLGSKDMMLYAHQRLARVYEDIGNLPKAVKHIKAFNKLKDELFSEQSQKIITEMQTKYETDKKEQEIKLLNNERELQHSVIQRQRLTIAISIGGIIVILAFAGLLINMVRQKQRANQVLEEKNELISHQKQEITDSIRYASRIQTAVLPSPTILSEALKDHFVLFLPRDIVSGDFYWFTRLGNKMVIVAADCTGHGVPGAFMSMLGVSFLYEIVNKEAITQPAEILNRLRELVKLTLSQTGKKDEQKDGMDISLSTLDLENMKLEWSGAYNPLILIRNNEVIEYKADKMPVAIHITDHRPFTNHLIDLKPDDVFYMFSDGFPDQFGGEEGRKFMSKRFRQLLLDIHHMPMDEQKELLYKQHLDWRGSIEQIDDIVVFGVKV